MSKHTYFLTLWLFGLLLSLPGHAQYATTPPVQDGVISDAEYNNTIINGVSTNKFTTASGGVWYMTWDADYLYVAKTGGQNYEPTLLYLDVNPLLPVTSGSPADGNLTGYSRSGDPNGETDYGVVPKLPFRGDVRVYCRDGGIEVRRADGSGGWSAAITTGLVSSTPNPNITREFRLSWNTLTNNQGIPAAFNWLGYATNNNSGPTNFRYDQAPENPAAAGSNGGTTPPLEYYFTVGNTGNNTATKPFSLKSYTFLGTSSVINFGAIDVWDFTMNSPGLSISRNSSTGGKWNISGSLVVNAGSIFFGSPAGGNFGDTEIGNIRLFGGVLKMDQTNKPTYVREDVSLTGGSQLILSGILGADLYVGRNFTVTNGTTTPATFQATDRAVVFTGTNVQHRIRANNGYVIPFPYLTLNSPAGTATLESDIALGQLLTFTDGLLFTGDNFVQLDGAGRLGTETAASHIVGNVRITQTLDPVATTGFGNLGLRLIPQNGAAAQGSVTLTRVTGTTIPGVGSGSNPNSIQRYFQLSAAGTSFANPNYIIEFAYRLDELNGTPESKLALYQSTTSSSGPYTRLTTPPSNNGARTISYNSQTALANTTFYTLSDGTTPTTLPVTLVSFSAQATAQGAALLNWATASEVNSKGFGIERQLGNGAWQPVGYVASGYANGGSYAFTDKSLATAPASAQAYYRLRQEDLDGTLSYSPVAVVARPAATDAPALVLSPVPVSGASLSLTFAEAGQAGSEITVSNTQGQRLLHFTTEASTNEALSLPVAQLAPGVYIVRVQVAGAGARYARFVKQ